jgi:cytosine/adenosine deaminase-related metal-dependent hydrolase
MSGYGNLPARRRLLVRGAHALTMDPALGEIVDCDVLVVDGAISAVGRGLVDASAEEIDGRGTIALPGFVDTHWHVWGTLLRGVIGDGPEHGWFARKARLGGHFSPGDTGQSVRLGLAEGLAAGITTVHDWAHNVLSPADADANLLAHRAVGLRVHFSYGAPSTHPSLSLEQAAKVMADGGKAPDQPMDFTEIERIRGRWADVAAEGLLTVGVAVRGPARSSPAVYRREWELARSLGLRISMHCAGTRAEVARIRQVQLLAADGLLGSDLLLAHGNHLAADDLVLLAEWGIPVSVSPLSELRLAMGFPQISEMLSAGVPVALSLDTTAISANADMFQTMRIAVGLENARLGDAQALSPRRALELATIDGARTLGLGAVTGSLSPGKRADLILVRTDRLSMAPVVDPAVAVVHSAGPADVDTVVVDGRILKREGRFTAIDPAVAVAEAKEALDDLCARAGFVPEVRPA